MDFPLRIPFVEHLRLELLVLGDGRAELQLDVEQHHTNNGVVAHGGIVMTLLDVAMAHAARTMAAPSKAGSGAALPADTGAVQASRQLVVTIEMKTSFMRPSRGRLLAVGTLLHRTAAFAFCEGRILDADGALCAHASGTFKYLRDAAPQPSTKG